VLVIVIESAIAAVIESAIAAVIESVAVLVMILKVEFLFDP